MISRTAAISERKAARERRRENLLQEKQERLAMEEKERQEAEQAAKEAMVQKRKDERRLAREVCQVDFLLFFLFNSKPFFF